MQMLTLKGVIRKLVITVSRISPKNFFYFDQVINNLSSIYFFFFFIFGKSYVPVYSWLDSKQILIIKYQKKHKKDELLLSKQIVPIECHVGVGN